MTHQQTNGHHTEAQERADQSPYRRTKGAADFIQHSPYTLEKWRSSGTGPRYHKAGKVVLYHIDDLREWMNARRFTSTSEEQAHDDAA